MKVYPLVLLLLATPLIAQFDSIGKSDRDNLAPHQSNPLVRSTDRIGWSSDGNLADEDDWAATPLALAVFAKMGWQDKLVHFDYNNRLDRSLEWKEAENFESTVGGARRFEFNEDVFFDAQHNLEAAIEHAKEEINKSHEGSKFWYVQAGPFEVAYQALLRADPEKRQYCILVSHSEVNERAGKWKLADGSPSHGKDDCVALGAKYFFTTNQYKEKFGGRTYKRWDLVEWMQTSSSAEYRWVHTRFLATAKHKDGGLDASDGGMAYVLATGDLDGNFSKLRDFLGSDWRTPNAPLAKVSVILGIDDEIAASAPVVWALGELSKALEENGVSVTTHPNIGTASAEGLVLVVASTENYLAQTILGKSQVSLYDSPEALALVEGNDSGRDLLLACGSDARGLGYALLELADRINCGIAPREALSVIEPIVEKPAMKIRSIYRPFASEIEDKSWYNDRAFWEHYLTELATQRVNRFTLALGMAYNNPKNCVDTYFHFAYPFLLDVPGFEVEAVGLPDEEREKNLEMLRYISDAAVERGIDFQLGLWTNAYNFPENVNYPIRGLNTEIHADYCREAISIILKECPSISGITYRVHRESGIAEGTEGFWEELFAAHKTAGRSVNIDMHGKSLMQDQLEWAIETGMPVTASPKYLGEHMGLGYHQTDIRRVDKGRATAYVEPTAGVHLTERKFTRAGYGDFMAEDRDWGVLHRIWPGTNVLLLAGDPALAASYGRHSGVFGSEGVERVDPLGFKGRKASGHPGGRCAYLDASLNPQWDFQKSSYTYRVWGRLLYNPDTNPEVWNRFLRGKFGEAGEALGVALANSSRVVHLMTTAHGEATDCTRYWPEIYMNMPIVTESDDITFRDNFPPRVFGNVSPHDPQIFGKINDFAASLLKGDTVAKYSPLNVAQWLEDLADTATRNLTLAESRVADAGDAEFRRFYHDIKIQCGLARFFSGKIRAGVLWHLYQESDDATAIVEAITHYTAARDAWAAMAEEAQAVYVSDVSFGIWAVERGHWMDRIPAMNADIADMKKELSEAIGIAPQKDVIKAIQTVNTRPIVPTVQASHKPAAKFEAGKPMKIELKLANEAQRVNLHYRHANQAILWEVMPMQVDGTRCTAVIPAEYTQTRYPMTYYFSVDQGESGQALFPGLDEELAGMPYYVVLQKPLAAVTLPSKPGAGEWQSLFNGSTLEGWHLACLEEDRGKDYWRVTDGAIECHSLGDKDHDYIWLCSNKEYDDFELKLKFQASRENIGNSGVQVRSRYDDSKSAPRGGWLDGPQVDIHPSDPWRNGLVYDETRGARGWIYPQLEGAKIGPDQVSNASPFKYANEGDGWNDLHIVCEGTRLQTIVNGVVVCDQDFAGVLDSAAHQEHDVGMSGRIALQIHAKAEVKISFKDIYLKEI